MARELSCAAVPDFDNNGTSIPDWGHLLLSEGEFLKTLSATNLGECDGLPQKITDYIYK